MHQSINKHTLIFPSKYYRSSSWRHCWRGGAGRRGGGCRHWRWRWNGWLHSEWRRSWWEWSPCEVFWMYDVFFVVKNLNVCSIYLFLQLYIGIIVSQRKGLGRHQESLHQPYKKLKNYLVMSKSCLMHGIKGKDWMIIKRPDLKMNLSLLFSLRNIWQKRMTRLGNLIFQRECRSSEISVDSNQNFVINWVLSCKVSCFYCFYCRYQRRVLVPPHWMEVA